MFLLCKHGMDWKEWDVLSASNDKDALQLKADSLNEEEYRQDAVDYEQGKISWRPLALNDPLRDGYKTYYVQQVPDWPDFDCSY